METENWFFHDAAFFVILHNSLPDFALFSDIFVYSAIFLQNPANMPFVLSIFSSKSV